MTRRLTTAIVLGCLSLLPLSLVYAQGQEEGDSKARLLQELNRDIWIPFSEAYASHDAEKYLRLHSRDLIRGEGDRKRVLNLAQYSENIRRFFKENKDGGGKIEIQFRFLERIVGDQSASERGIYRLTGTPLKGPARTFYGKFHVFSRKENGVWKILIDYDSNEGKTIDEKAFQAGAALDDFAAF